MRFILGTIFILAVAGILVLSCFTSHRLPPNTYLAGQNYGFWQTNSLLTHLAKQSNPKLKIKVQNRTYQFNYQNLGIVFDLNATYADLTKETKLSLIKRLINFYQAFWSSRTVMPKLIFTQDYYEKLKTLEFDFSAQTDQIMVNSRQKNLVYENYQDRFLIDPQSLNKEIVNNFGKSQVLKPQLHRVFDDQMRLKVEDYNQRLEQAVSDPVNLHYENGQQLNFKLQKPDLQLLLIISYDQLNQQLSIGISESVLKQKAQELGQQLNLGQDLQFDLEHLKQNLTALIMARFNHQESDSVWVRLIEKPNTDGTRADKYIEIDLSQQKMYRWQQGKNIAIHRISSGLYYPTPPGEYQILNKAVNAYSNIYHVWMPYWMAFSLDPKVNAYLGIHELPYWIDYSGQEIRRPRDFIGSPHTGGCVSLDIGEAKIVYEWAKVGTPVFIFD